MGSYTGQDHIKHSRIGGEAAKPVHMKSEVKTKLSIPVEYQFFDFTGRPLITADYLTRTSIGHWEICTLSRVTGST
jgi:hypothetical protein